MSDRQKRDRGWKRAGEILEEGTFGKLLGTGPAPVAKPPSWGKRPLLTADSRRPCPHGCGRENGTVGSDRPGYGMFYLWEVCPCRDEVWAGEHARKEAQITAGHSTQPTEVQMVNASLAQVAHFTLSDFASKRLTSTTAETHPLAVATTWLERILPLPHGDYRDEHTPPVALYFYSRGNGRGKTHLAAAVANAAKEAKKRVAFVNEQTYLANRWSLSLEGANAYTSLLSERAWLTVIDDLGARSRVSDTVSDAWYELLNDRWLGERWTIITSNKTPDELLEQGTINIATWSRIGQMTEMELVEFVGDDQRLR